MKDQLILWASKDYQNINNYEKLLKVIQYSLNFLHIYLKSPILVNTFKQLSQARRIFRLFNQFHAINQILAFGRHPPNLQRVLRLVSNILMLVFLTLDALVLAYQLKFYNNRAVMGRVFEFMDVMWIVQNGINILETLISLQRQADS